MVPTTLFIGGGYEMFDNDMIMYATIDDQQPVRAIINISFPWLIDEFYEP